MKKIFTLLAIVSLGSFAFGQTVYQSDLSSWSAGDPTDWMGSSTNIASSRVLENMTLPNYGTSRAALINTSSTHNRFSTQDVSVVPGESYLVEMWVACLTSGELRTNYYDVSNTAYGTYNPYIDVANVSAGNQVLISQTVTIPAGCNSAQFILSLRNTDVTQAVADIGIMLDSVAITATTPPVANNKSIYEIQYTSAPSGDSPEMGNIVTTRGVVTGIMEFGAAEHSFFIQDSASAWNGLYVYHTNDSTLLIGDSVEVTGTVIEFNNLTELTSVSSLNVINSGNTLPTPVTNTTMSSNNEQWEGVLINVTNAECTSNSLGFGMWELNDASGVTLADDDIFPYATIAVVGNYYDVTGIGHYSFNEFKILPRDINDISISSNLKEFNISSVSVYPNPVKDNITFETETNRFSVTVIDITGKTIGTNTSVNNKLNMSISHLNNGVYFYSVVDNNGTVIATNKFVVAR